MASQSFRCRICNSDDSHSQYIAQEMMFGTRESFEYFQCSQCQCLQIASIPESLTKYYPRDYAAHSPEPLDHKTPPPPPGYFEKLRYRSALFSSHELIHRLMGLITNQPRALLEKPNQISSIRSIIRRSELKDFSSRILDVGCGSHSYWLSALENLGFYNLHGIDPLISRDRKRGTILIEKKDLSELTGTYDLITLHHSLEHIPDQHSTLKLIRDRLSNTGVCVIRIPIVSSTAWERYKSDWVELDAPRHLYLHSPQSLNILAAHSDLEIYDIQYDSTAFEFYGSELYLRGIHLTHENSPWINPVSTIFSHKEMQEFREMARLANENHTGGRAAFFIRRKNGRQTRQ